MTNPLSFSNLKEFETTKHVHRLHPYRGKFIPQLAEYFLKKHFKPGDIILDPFCGSGTTLVQCAEMGIDAIGIDVSEFAVFLTNVKLGTYDRKNAIEEINIITKELGGVETKSNTIQTNFIFSKIKEIKSQSTKKFLALILSRVINVKSENHPDIFYWWRVYSIDSLNRVIEFEKLRTNSHQLCISADSKTVDLIKEVEKRSKTFTEFIRTQKIKGIVTSPPYVGVIDYHQEHSLSYKLFGFKRKDEMEIGPKFKGEGKKAREEYSKEMIKVFLNLKKYLTPDCEIIIVVNDKFNLYPWIIKESGFQIVEKLTRPVLNRISDKKTPYSEKIYHLHLLHSSL